MDKRTVSTVLAAIIIASVFVGMMSIGAAKPADKQIEGDISISDPQKEISKLVTFDPDGESWLGNPYGMSQDILETNKDYMIRVVFGDCESRPGTYTDYLFAEMGPFYNLDAYMNWEVAPPHGYIYPAFTYGFQAGQGGYMGTQLVGGTKKAIFSIWDSVENSGTAQPAHQNCRRFGGEGTGAQCLIDYDWQQGREYRLRLWGVCSNDSGETWVGAIYDTVTEVETVIGYIYLKNVNEYKGYGWLNNRASVFLEYFGGEMSCHGQPHAKVTWRGPYANSGTYIADQASVPFYSCCSTNDVFSTGYPYVTHEAGDDVQKTTPEGTMLWEQEVSGCIDFDELDQVDITGQTLEYDQAYFEAEGEQPHDVTISSLAHSLPNGIGLFGGTVTAHFKTPVSWVSLWLGSWSGGTTITLYASDDELLEVINPSVGDFTYYNFSYDKKISKVVLFSYEGAFDDFCFEMEKVPDGWHMFRHDPAHTSKVSGKADDTPPLQVVWTKELDDIVDTSPAVVYERVYVGSGHFFYVLDEETGEEIWKKDFGKKIDSSPAVGYGKVFVATTYGRLYAFSAKQNNDEYLWVKYLDSGSNQYGPKCDLFSSPVVADNKIFIGNSYSSQYPDYRIKDSGHLWALWASNGAEAWTNPFEAAGPIFSSPAVADDKVFFGCNNYPSETGTIYCLDANDGHKIWEYQTGGGVVSSPTIANGIVFIGCNDGKVYALREDDENQDGVGDLVWSYNIGEGKIVSSSPAYTCVPSLPPEYQESIIVGCYDGFIYCLNAFPPTEEGELRWFDQIGAGFSSPALYYPTDIIGASPFIYIGSDDGHLYLYSYFGDRINRYPCYPEGSGEAYIGVVSSPAIANSKVFVGSRDHRVYCFGKYYGPKIIEVDDGWDLISVPLNLTTWKLGDESTVGDPLNVTPENSLTSIYRYNTTSESFEKCTHYADWGWAPATGSESFTELEPSRSYWVMAENDCTLTFTGTAPSDLDVPLDADWNCIGWYSTSTALLGEEAIVGDPLNVTPENSLTSIYRYDTTSESFEKCTHYEGWGWAPATGSESFTELEPGRGYWVMAENDCVWGHEV